MEHFSLLKMSSASFKKRLENKTAQYLEYVSHERIQWGSFKTYGLLTKRSRLHIHFYKVLLS